MIYILQVIDLLNFLGMNIFNVVGIVNMDFILMYMFDIYVWLFLIDVYLL